MRIHLGNDHLRILGSCLSDVHRRTKRAHAILIGGRDLDKGNINGNPATGKLPGNFGEEDWNVVTLSFPNGFPNATIYKKAFKPIFICQDLNQVWCCSHGKEVVDTSINDMG